MPGPELNSTSIGSQPPPVVIAPAAAGQQHLGVVIQEPAALNTSVRQIGVSNNWAYTSDSNAILWCSIGSSVFCCLLGSPSVFLIILAIFFAIKARMLDSQGKRSEAKMFFMVSLNLNVLALLCGLIFLIVEIVVIVKFTM